MKQIPLTQGKFALVDDDTYLAIGHLKWYAHFEHNTWYALRNFRKGTGKQAKIRLHHIVMGFPLNNMEIDHKDGNGLNNQRDNLRLVTHRKNQQNTHNHRNGKLAGAHYFKPDKIWRARIYINGKLTVLGYFKTEQEAHKAYMEALYDWTL
jgi:hypothetical protein